MRIAWFTPFSAPSAIGVFSKMVTRELAKYCPVDIWGTTTKEPFYHTELPVFDLARLEHQPELLEGYTHYVYNLGNHLQLHQQIFNVSQQRPGIVILHDYVMHHYFAEYFLDQQQDQKGYRALIQKFYGKNAAEYVMKQLERGNQIWDSPQVMDYPLFEACLKNHYGMVTHSHFFREAVEQHTFYPVTTIPLPWIIHEELAHQAQTQPKPTHSETAGRLLLVSFGMIGPNKRIDKVLETLGKNPELARQVEYRILGRVGSKTYEKTLRNIVAKYHMESHVKFLGYQPHEQLYKLLRTADICINLRFPTTEGGSGALTDALFFGCPTIVTNVGCYRDVPDECVRKIGLEYEEQELAQTLRELIAYPDRRQQMSENALRYSQTRLHPAHYARIFMTFLERAEQHTPQRKLLGRISKELATMGVASQDSVLKSIGTEMGKIWPTKPPIIAPKNLSVQSGEIELFIEDTDFYQTIKKNWHTAKEGRNNSQNR